jgi:hypothetical protein
MGPILLKFNSKIQRNTLIKANFSCLHGFSSQNSVKLVFLAWKNPYMGHFCKILKKSKTSIFDRGWPPKGINKAWTPYNMLYGQKAEAQLQNPVSYFFLVLINNNKCFLAFYCAFQKIFNFGAPCYNRPNVDPDRKKSLLYYICFLCMGSM